MTLSLYLVCAVVLVNFASLSWAVPVSKSSATPIVKVEKTSAIVGKELVVKMDNKLIDGKKVWVATPTEIPLGSNVKIEIQNKLAEPHGFELVGYAKPLVVLTNTKASVSFKADKAGPVEFKCHMHPAHVGGKLQVK